MAPFIRYASSLSLTVGYDARPAKATEFEKQAQEMLIR